MPRLTTSTKLKIAFVGLAAVDTRLAGQTQQVGAPGAVRDQAAADAYARRIPGHPCQAASSPLRTSTLLAQAGGWGGDVALLGGGTKPFLAGAGSFALGHVAYLTGFLRARSPTPVTAGAAPRAVVAAWALTAPPMAVMAYRQHHELGAPVLGYATMLAAVVVGAAHLDPALSPTSRRLTAAGAGLFMVSDTMLGIRKFMLETPPPALETAVMATYAAAQFLLSEGAARA